MSSHDAIAWRDKDISRLERRVSFLESELKELRQALATVQGGEIANSEAICALQPLPGSAQSHSACAPCPNSD
jgi:hypothetical protein